MGREEDPQRTLPVMDLKRLLEPEVVKRAPDWPTNQRPELKQNLTTRADQVGLKMELTASGVTRFMTRTPNRLLNFDAVFLIQPKVLSRDAFGTDFVCLCCRTEFRLPKMAFYEAGVNSMLTGFCFIGQHTQDASEIDYQQDGGAALCCEEAGCIEYFV